MPGCLKHGRRASRRRRWARAVRVSGSSERSGVRQRRGWRNPCLLGKSRLAPVSTVAPGPMAAWARSTGAMLPERRLVSAVGSSAFNAAMNSRRVARVASPLRRLQTSTTLKASALLPMLIERPVRSVRIGHVPVTSKPEPIAASRNFSHPVLTVPASAAVSDCLKA